MASISTSTGLISGINSKDIIDQLMALESRPKTKLQTRIDAVGQQKLAYVDLQTRLTGLKLNGTTLKKSATFQNAATTSSDEDVLTATASAGAAVGSYQFQVARLVTTQQTISKGFADFDSEKVGAGNITVEMGGGDLSEPNLLSQLNGGEGVRRGMFKITDRSGATAVIDTTAAVTLDDVLKKINTSLDISVRATISGDQIKLEDLTGKTTNNFIVQDVGEGKAAADLGLVADVAATSVTGTDVNYLGRSTALSQLNDGRGVRLASTGSDLNLALSDGSNIEVTLAGKKGLADVIDAINTAGGSKVKAELVAGGNGLKITDTSGGGGALAITDLNGSHAATDLGLTGASTGGVVNGTDVLAGLGTVLLSSLNGGQGFAMGSIEVKSRAAGGPVDIDLQSAKSVADVIKLINDAGVGVKASLNSAGNGLQIEDTSGGNGDLVISDSSGTTAADFGIAGTFGADKKVVKGANLQRQWVSENSLLADLNGGKGITPGKFIITNTKGISATVDLTQGNEIRMEDVIKEINSRGIGVTATINAHGDGLLLTDTAGGSLKMKVVDDSGSAASDLRIKGTSTNGTTLDGSYETTIAVTATDTLQDVQKKINDAAYGINASIVNDGSGLAPYRLSINARNSGRDGRVVFDTGATNLDTRNLVEAQDAAVFIGGADSSQPLLITASKNQLAGVIKGVNIELNGVSDKPVTLNVSRNVDNVVSEVQKFADGFNEMVDKITELTKYDTETNERGLLLGEVTVQTIQTELYSSLQSVNAGAGRYRIFADVGITVADGAKVQFDEEKFRAAYANDPDSVEKLFTEIDSVEKNGKTTAVSTGLAHILETRIGKLIDPVNGVVTRENKTLDQQTTEFKDRMDSLDTSLTQKRARLEKQFANLESVLAKMQSQQQSIGQIQSVSAG